MGDEEAKARGILKEVKAQSLVLVDGQGSKRAELSVGEDGPGLDFYDIQGRRRLRVGFAEDIAPSVCIYNVQGTALAVLGVDPSGDNTVLELYGAHGFLVPRVKLYAAGDSANLSLLDDRGRARAHLGVADNGNPFLGLLDSQGEVRVELTVDEHGDSVLRLFDAQGKVFQAPQSQTTR